MGKKKNTSTVEPLKAYRPYIDSGAKAYQTTYQQQQPMGGAVQGVLAGALGHYAQKAMRPDSFLEGSKAALGATARGDYLGANPGAATYGRWSAANDPSIGALSSMTGEREVGDYSGFGRNNPAMGRLTAFGDSETYGAAPTSTFYSDTLSGKYLDNNPAFDDVLQQALEDAENRVRQQASMAGRSWGRSTDHTGLMTRELAKVSSQMRFAQYNAERERQMQAAQLADGSYSGSRGRQLQAYGLLSDAANEGDRIGLAATQAGDQARQAEYDGRARTLGLLSDAWGRNAGINLDAARAGDQVWDAERGRMVTAANGAADFGKADYYPIEGLLGLAQGTLDAPWVGANNYGEGIGGLLGNYTKQTDVKSKNFWQQMGDFANFGRDLFAISKTPTSSGGGY